MNYESSGALPDLTTPNLHSPFIANDNAVSLHSIYGVHVVQASRCSLSACSGCLFCLNTLSPRTSTQLSTQAGPPLSFRCHFSPGSMQQGRPACQVLQSTKTARWCCIITRTSRSRKKLDSTAWSPRPLLHQHACFKARARLTDSEISNRAHRGEFATLIPYPAPLTSSPDHLYRHRITITQESPGQRSL